MKNFLLILFFSGSYSLYAKSSADVFSIQTRSVKPVSASYRDYEYYYFPEIDIYYDIPNRRFVCFENDRWVYYTELPYIFHNYDISHGFKVLIREYKPYLRADEYRNMYRDAYENYNHRSQGTYHKNPQTYFPEERSRRTDDRTADRDIPQDIDQRGNNHPKRQDLQSRDQNNSRGNGISDDQQNNPSSKKIPGIQKNTVPNQTTVEDQKNIKDGKDSSTTHGKVDNEKLSEPSRKEVIHNIQENAGQKMDTKKDEPGISIKKDSKHNEINNISKDSSSVPSGINVPAQKMDTKEDAQRSHNFYGNGQSNGPRDAVRNPKFNTINGTVKTVQDTLYIVPQKINNDPKKAQKDTLHPGN